MSGDLRAAAGTAVYRTPLRRDLAGSDALHWGEGSVGVGRNTVALDGRLAAGPDCKPCLAPSYVEDEAASLRVTERSQRIGEVKTFANFVVPVPSGVDIDRFATVVVRCERFGQFITSARYR